MLRQAMTVAQQKISVNAGVNQIGAKQWVHLSRPTPPNPFIKKLPDVIDLGDKTPDSIPGAY
jgi:hypothetical protein